MDIQGTLSALLPAVTGQGKNGPWKKQEFILDIPGTYPKKLCISTWGDRVPLNDFKPGDSIKVHFDLESREWNGKWFTEVKAWKVERAAAGANGPSDMPPPPDNGWTSQAPPPMATQDLPADDLPF